MSDTNGNGNGKNGNGTFLKILVPVLTILTAGMLIGGVQLYREVGELRSALRAEAQWSEALRAVAVRVDKNEDRLNDIDKARNERSSWGMRLENVERRQDRMEGRR